MTPNGILVRDAEEILSQMQQTDANRGSIKFADSVIRYYQTNHRLTQAQYEALRKWVTEKKEARRAEEALKSAGVIGVGAVSVSALEALADRYDRECQKLKDTEAEVRGRITAMEETQTFTEDYKYTLSQTRRNDTFAVISAETVEFRGNHKKMGVVIEGTQEQMSLKKLLSLRKTEEHYIAVKEVQSLVQDYERLKKFYEEHPKPRVKLRTRVWNHTIDIAAVAGIGAALAQFL